MLQELNEELAGAVLRRLAAADVRRARLACRALDAASRSHLDAATCIKLTGDNVKKAAPDWARFPRLSKLRVWSKDYYAHNPKYAAAAAADKRLRRCFAPQRTDTAAARRALARVHSLELAGESSAWEPLLEVLLPALPALTQLTLPDVPHDLNGIAADALLAGVAAAAPRLTSLDATDCSITAAGAAAIARLPALRELQLGCLGGGWDGGEVAAALPRCQLTSLCYRGAYAIDIDVQPAGSPATSYWPQLRELRGVYLPFEHAELLAAGLPALALLAAEPTGDWGPTPAAFPSVTEARLHECTERFSPARLATLLPAVQSLVIQSDGNEGEGADDRFEPCFDISGLTALTHLDLSNSRYGYDGVCPLVPESMLAAAGVLPSLTHLAIVIEAAALPRLAQLPSTQRLTSPLPRWIGRRGPCQSMPSCLHSHR